MALHCPFDNEQFFKHTHTHTHTQPAWNHRSSHSNQTPLGEWVVWELYHKIKQNRKFPQMIRKNSLCGKQSQKELLYFWTSGLWLLWPNFPLLLWVSLIFPPLFLQVSKDLEIVISLGGGTEKNPCFLSSLCKLKKNKKQLGEIEKGGQRKAVPLAAVYKALIQGIKSLSQARGAASCSSSSPVILFSLLLSAVSL